MLVACSTTTATLNKNHELTIKTSGPSPFYSVRKLAVKSRNDFDAICSLITGISHSDYRVTAATGMPEIALTLADVSKTLKAGKSIIDLFPVNKVDWSAECIKSGPPVDPETGEPLPKS